MKFFQMWYSRQPSEIKKQVKKLIKSGQLEITQGGWSSTDEACPNYEDLINNMYLGHAFLLKEFGVRPKVGWHVDPFGHSAANAALFSDFGFEAIFISRLDEEERQRRQDEKSMTFVWNPFSNNFGEEK
jgi:alpha-mannosidase